jgi:hypothetical protein
MVVQTHGAECAPTPYATAFFSTELNDISTTQNSDVMPSI